ncbi:MAG: asparagine synthase family protein, partial [Halobacteriota archaeon]
GIVGAVGVRALEAVPKMCEILKHRGGVHRSFRGRLTAGTAYAVSALGRATPSEASSSPGSAISVSDSYYAGYARARIVSSHVLILDRDCIGSRPLFYGVNNASSLCAFASERKALWSVGIVRTHRVNPRTMVVIREPREIDVNVKKTPELSHEDLAFEDESHAVAGLRNVLECVLNELAPEKMSVAFSGGVDSSLLCRLMARPANNQYYAVGLSGSHDLDSAQHAARLLHVDLQTIELDAGDVEMLIPRVIEAIESCSPLDIAIALPLYVLSEQAAAAGFTSILTGQGADELFAGYSKYASLPSVTSETLRSAIETDVLNIARDNLERDNLAAASHSLDVVLPYLDPRVIFFGLAIDGAWKLHNGINKYVLRKVAEQVMPHELAYRQKKAIQYGTGVSATLQRLARKRNLPSTNGRGALRLYLRSIAEKHGIAVTE